MAKFLSLEAINDLLLDGGWSPSTISAALQQVNTSLKLVEKATMREIELIAKAADIEVADLNRIASAITANIQTLTGEVHKLEVKLNKANQASTSLVRKEIDAIAKAGDIEVAKLNNVIKTFQQGPGPQAAKASQAQFDKQLQAHSKELKDLATEIAKQKTDAASILSNQIASISTAGDIEVTKINNLISGITQGLVVSTSGAKVVNMKALSANVLADIASAQAQLTALTDAINAEQVKVKAQSDAQITAIKATGDSEIVDIKKLLSTFEARLLAGGL